MLFIPSAYLCGIKLFQMKKSLLVVLLSSIFIALCAQEKPKIYNPQANARAEIAHAIQMASQTGKHVFLQIGGNWCPWCIKFHRFVHDTPALDSLLNQHYIVCMVNFSKENKNLDILAELEYPQRFGFPVFVILDGQGKRLHTQDSGLLESSEGYDLKKVQSFLQNWTAEALKPEKYQK